MNAKNVVVTVLALLIILLTLFCQKPKDESMANKAVVRQLIDEAWNKGNLSVIDELLSPDYVLHVEAPGARKDREGYKQAVSMYRSAMPDFQFTIDDMFAEGDKVVIRCTMTGTHEGELMGTPPTAKTLTMTAISIRHFENGKIVEEWVETNMLGFMQQMGVIPSPGQPARE